MKNRDTIYNLHDDFNNQFEKSLNSNEGYLIPKKSQLIQSTTNNGFHNLMFTQLTLKPYLFKYDVIGHVRRARMPKEIRHFVTHNYQFAI